MKKGFILFSGLVFVVALSLIVVSGDWVRPYNFFSGYNDIQGFLTMHNDNPPTLSLTTTSFHNITVFDINNTNQVGLANNYTFIILEPGDYSVDYSMSFTGSTDTYEMVIAKNGVIQNTTGRAHRRLANVADVGNMASFGIILNASAGDIINLQVRDQDQPVNNIDIISTTMQIRRSKRLP